MQDFQKSAVILNPPDYKKAIEKNNPFYIQFPFYSAGVEIIFLQILYRFLGRHDILYLRDMLITVIRELVTNAVKANIKRIYFKKKNLDIKQTDDYRVGMENFKREVYGKDSDFFEKFNATEPALFVRVTFEANPEYLKIKILNNTPILKEELIKIQARIKKAYTYTDLGDAFDDVLDDSEGAGLGLIIAMMLFKNANLPTDTFNIFSVKEGTTAEITLPTKLKRQQTYKKVTDEIIKEVEKIPSFPENILEIQRLCIRPDSTIKEISERIKLDPGLTTAILKLANSAGFITLKKTKTMEEAVMLIGLKSVNTLLLATGAQKIIESRFKKCEDIWKSSYRTAFYARQIASRKRNTGIAESAYLAALLSDIGKIVLLSIKPGLSEKIQALSGMKGNIDSQSLEEITLGIDHSTLGGLICRHWNFDEELAQTIEYHHRPYMGQEESRDLMNTVYMAYQFSEIEERKSRFETIDEEVLEKFNLQTREDFNSFHENLKKAYSKQYTS